MTEPEQTEFSERIDRPILTRGLARGGIVLGSALLLVIGVMSAMGASPAPSTGTDPSTGAQPSPGTTAQPATPNGGPMMGGQGFFGFGRHGDGGPGGFGVGFGGVTITAINGSNLSLKTDDGWTRTIAVTSDTTITRAGTTITVSDLKVGDEITFRQQRQDDGTYTITEIRLVIPTVAGEVTKVDGSTITILRRDGTTQVVHVDSSTDLSGRRRDEPDDLGHQGRRRHRRPRHPERRWLAQGRGRRRRCDARLGSRRRWPRQDPGRRVAERLPGTLHHPGLTDPDPDRRRGRSLGTAASFDSHELLRRRRFHG